MNEDRLRESPKLKTSKPEPTLGLRTLTLKPRSFPVTIAQCPPGPLVYDGSLYFKSASGTVYMDNGLALPGEFGEFGDFGVSPVFVEWDELVDGDMEPNGFAPWTTEMENSLLSLQSLQSRQTA